MSAFCPILTAQRGCAVHKRGARAHGRHAGLQRSDQAHIPDQHPGLLWHDLPGVWTVRPTPQLCLSLLLLPRGTRMESAAVLFYPLA